MRMHKYPLYYEVEDYEVKYTHECHMYNLDETPFMAVGVKVGEWITKDENGRQSSDIIRWMTEKKFNTIRETMTGVVIY